MHCSDTLVLRAGRIGRLVAFVRGALRCEVVVPVVPLEHANPETPSTQRMIAPNTACGALVGRPASTRMPGAAADRYRDGTRLVASRTLLVLIVAPILIPIVLPCTRA